MKNHENVFAMPSTYVLLAQNNVQTVISKPSYMQVNNYITGLVFSKSHFMV